MPDISPPPSTRYQRYTGPERRRFDRSIKLSDDEVRLLALAEPGYTYRASDVAEGTFDDLVDTLRRLHELGLVRLDEGRIMRSQRGGYLMAGPCDLTEAGRGALDQDRQLGPRASAVVPYTGPERRRAHRRPPSAPRVIGRARIRPEHHHHAPALTPDQWYPLIEQPAEMLTPRLEGYVWIDVGGRPRSIWSAFLELEPLEGV